MSQAEQALILAVTAENAVLKDRPLNIYLLSQDENIGYDNYDSCVVVAESEEEAAKIHPLYHWACEWWKDLQFTPQIWQRWASHPNNVHVERIGKADPSQEKGLILASFNLG